MAGHGGFEHNLQSLRVVDVLEARYPAFDGLNLCFESREGILKHCSRVDAERLERGEPNGVARRFLDGSEPSLEAQLADLVDEIAYDAHDIDDGVRSGLLGLEQLLGLSLLRRHHDAARRDHPSLGGRRLLFEVIRRMLSEQVHDVVDATAAAVGSAAPAGADAVRGLQRLVRFSASMRAESTALKRLLMRELYRHPQVVQTTACARTVVRELFDAYAAAPSEMAPEFAGRDDRMRAIADYVAGMTDRFACREHRRLTGRDAFADASPLPGASHA
jgi:dGTPase